MKRIGILTAGGDTPALNATIHGAVVRANQLQDRDLRAHQGLQLPVQSARAARPPESAVSGDPGARSDQGRHAHRLVARLRRSDKKDELDLIASRLQKLGIEGLIAVGGDGTLNGLQPLAERLPTVLAPKTIDNDLGLNYPSEPDEWVRVKDPDAPAATATSARASSAVFDLNQIVNYATPGYATAVLVTAQGVERIRTTAESHRRIAIIEVMGRHSGYIALGTAYGQPDIILIPEHPLDIELLVERVRHLYDLQKNVVIVCGEGIVDEQGVELGAESTSTDPAGNVALSGAAEALRAKMIELLGDRYFQRYRRGSSAREAIFTRKVGHTQRGGRPILFDRFYAALLGVESGRSAGRGTQQRRVGSPIQRRQGLSRGRLRRESVSRPLGPDPRPADASVALRSAADEAVAGWASTTCCRFSPMPSATTTPSTCGRRCSIRATCRSRITRSTPTSTSASAISRRTAPDGSSRQRHRLARAAGQTLDRRSIPASPVTSLDGSTLPPTVRHREPLRVAPRDSVPVMLKKPAVVSYAIALVFLQSTRSHAEPITAALDYDRHGVGSTR